jgi:hypothetical protein
MGFVRKALLVLLAPLFSVLLFVMALDFGVLRIAGQPAGVKKIVADSGVYQTAVPDALAQAKQISGSSTQIPLTQQAVLDAAGQAFTPQVVQQSTESAIDGIYDWLNGKSPTPDFSIDLTPVKATFASNVAQAAQKQAASLPICPTSTLPSNFDAFSATCLPKGISLSQIALNVQNDVMSGKGFLEHPVITANSVKTSDGQPFFATKLKDAPKQFQRIKKTPTILTLLSIVVAVGIIFLSSSRRKGIRRVGITLVTVGVFMLIFAWALNWGVNQKLLPNLKLDNAVLGKDVKSLAGSLTQSIDKNYWTFGGLYSALGATFAGTTLIKRHKRSTPQQPEAAESSDRPPVSAYRTGGHSAAQAPRPPKKIIKIQ